MLQEVCTIATKVHLGSETIKKCEEIMQRRWADKGVHCL